MQKGEKITEEARRKQSESMKKRWASYSKEKRAEMSAHSSAHNKQYWNNISQEALDKKSITSSKNTKAFWDGLSQEEYQEQTKKVSVTLKEYYKTEPIEKKKSKHAKIAKANTGKNNTKETKKKIAKRTKELHEEGVLGSHTGMQGKHHSKETRKRMSEVHAQLNIDDFAHAEGLYFSFKSGRNLPFQSSYELEAFKILDKMSEVVQFDRCRFFINYISQKGDSRRYVPDILVKWLDGQSEVIEVKPTVFLRFPDVQLKAHAAQKYCEQNNMVYSFWTERELGLVPTGETK